LRVPAATSEKESAPPTHAVTKQLPLHSSDTNNVAKSDKQKTAALEKVQSSETQVEDAQNVVEKIQAEINNADDPSASINNAALEEAENMLATAEEEESVAKLEAEDAGASPDDTAAAERGMLPSVSDSSVPGRVSDAKVDPTGSQNPPGATDELKPPSMPSGTPKTSPSSLPSTQRPTTKFPALPPGLLDALKDAGENEAKNTKNVDDKKNKENKEKKKGKEEKGLPESTSLNKGGADKADKEGEKDSVGEKASSEGDVPTQGSAGAGPHGRGNAPLGGLLGAAAAAAAGKGGSGGGSGGGAGGDAYDLDALVADLAHPSRLAGALTAIGIKRGKAAAATEQSCPAQ